MERQIAEAAAAFPEKFGLRAFPNQRFTINQRQSYVSRGEVFLYIFTEDGQAFTKGTPDELEREVVR